MQTRRAARWAAGLLAALALFSSAGILAWRFASDVVGVDFLKPRIVRGLEAAAPGLRIDFDRLVVRWGGWRRGIDLVASDTRVATDEFAAAIPEIVLKLSLRAMLSGRFLPSEIEIVGIAGKLIREPSGTFRLAAVGTERTAPVGADVLQRLFEDLGAAPTPQRPLTFMRHLRLRDATFDLEDRANGVVWTAERIDVEMHAGGHEVSGVYRTVLDLDDSEAPIEGALHFDGTEDLLHIEATFADLPADSVATRIPALASTVRLRAGLSGALHAAVTLTGALRTLSFDVAASPGSVSVSHWLDRPEPLAEASVRGSFDAEGQRWTLSDGELVFGDPAAPGPTFALSATATAAPAATQVAAQLSVTNLAVTDLGRFWPHEVETGTRTWILEHIGVGSIPELLVHADIELPNEPAATAEPIRVERLEGTLRLSELSVRWDKQAPAIDGISGRGRIARDALEFTVDRGDAAGVRITRATVGLLDIDHPPARLQIDVAGEGPLDAALRAAKLQPPGFIRAEPGSGDDAARAAFRARIDFALDGRVAFDDLDLIVEADIDGAVVDADLARGRASGRLDFAAANGARRLQGAVDIRDVTSAVPHLGWRKEAGESGHARFDLSLGVRGIETIDSFEVLTASAQASGSARFEPHTNRLRQLDFTALRAGRTNPVGATLEWDGDDLSVELRGGSIDLTPLLATPTLFHTGADASLHASDAAHLRAAAIAVDTLYLSESGWLENVTGAIHRRGDSWIAAEVDGRIPHRLSALGAAAPRAVRLRAAPSPGTGLHAELTTDDFGGLATALGWTRAIGGGTLRIQSSDLDGGLDAGTIQIDAQRFSVSDTPALVRLLSLASLDALVTALQGEALAFDRLTGRIDLSARSLQFDGVRAHGSSLGWSAHGSIDRETAAVDLDGILVPAYGANRILTALPIVRELLVGEGLFAVDFHVGGSLAAPDVDVHAMSALTPEILRGIFGYADATR